MQALSFRVPIGDSCRLPHQEFHPVSSCLVLFFKKRRKRVVFSRNFSGFRDGVFLTSAKPVIGIESNFGQSRKSSFLRFCVALGCEPVEQAAGEDLERDNSTSAAGLSGVNMNENGTSSDVERLGGSSGLDTGDAGGEKVERISSSRNRVAENSRVDVFSLGKSLLFAESTDDVDIVMKDLGALPLQVYSSLLKGFGREKKLKPAIALVKWLKQKSQESEGFAGPNSFVYNSLLGAVRQSGQYDKVEMVMSDMADGGISPNTVTYNTLMSIKLDQGQPHEAISVLEKMQCEGLSPSPVSYSTALLAYRNMEDGIGALKFFVEIRGKYTRGELPMTEGADWGSELVEFENFICRICYQVMRRWLVSKENLSTQVLKLLMEMDKCGLTPSQVEHEKLIWACTREEHYIVAKELYTRIRENGFDVRLSVCNHVIWLLGKAKKWWAALEVYEEMLDKGPNPNNMSYELIISHFNVLLSSAKKRGIWKWGMGLLDKMESKGLKPGSREWNAVLIACSKASETEAAVQVFRRMVERGAKPTVISYGALLSALEKGKLYDEAIRVWEHMIKVGLEPNLYAFTIMASVYVGLGKFKIVDFLIQEMITTKNDPTVVTFNAIITVCARNGWGTLAYEWFNRMTSMSIDPNEVSYEMLIEALAKDGKPKVAFEMYTRAYHARLILSAKAYDLVVESSRDLGSPIDVGLMGPRPPEKKKNEYVQKNVSKSADVSRRSDPFGRQDNYSQQASGS